MNRADITGPEADARREGIDSGDIQNEAAVVGSDLEASRGSDTLDIDQKHSIDARNKHTTKIPEGANNDIEELGSSAKDVNVPPQDTGAARQLDDTGPFGLLPRKDSDPFSFSYYLKPGIAQSDKQLALALRVGSLMQQISRFRADPTAANLAEQLRGIFQAGLVQASTSEADVFDRHVSALETEFLNRVVTPAHRSRISEPTFNTLYAFIFLSVLGALLYHSNLYTTPDSSLAGYGKIFSSLIFVVAGTLLGRLFFMVATHQTMVTSINQFDTDGARIGNGGFVIFLDAIVGVIAFLVFFTGFLQIAIGANEVNDSTEQVRSALSTLDIKSKPSVAYLFGVIVGIARTQFIARVSSLSRERLE
ncbi:hypothetical protein E2976_15155 [Paracoccus yeei]|uniref:hypothetical protein n=1 Tax=Paracoccus yeei TaxID=147645 RepID=UPI003BF78992